MIHIFVNYVTVVDSDNAYVYYIIGVQMLGEIGVMIITYQCNITAPKYISFSLRQQQRPGQLSQSVYCDQRPNNIGQGS